jgi:ABC-type antimicrobial peptide transport system permease subunit
VALLLGMVGIYGVISYVVSQRTREIGVRMALGARAPDVQAMVVRQGMKVTLIGVGAGLAAALVLTRLMRAVLFEISPTDPLTLVVVPLALLAVSSLACWLPARRAARIDPVRALALE